MHRLTKVLAFKLYKVDYESNRTHGMMDKNGLVQNRLSGHFYGMGGGGVGSAGAGSLGGRKMRSRHLSIQDEQRGNNGTRTPNTSRPISMGGGGGLGSSSEGQLIDLTTNQPYGYDRVMVDLSDGFPLPPGIEIPTATVSTSFSPSSTAAAAGGSKHSIRGDFGGGGSTSFLEKSKANDRRSGTGLAAESIEEDKVASSSSGAAPTGSHSTSRKFGIKNIIPTATFSSSHPSSTAASVTDAKDDHNKFGSSGSTSTGSLQQNHIGGGGSTNSSLGSRRGKRTVSIHQFDHLFQESGSKLLNFVHQTTSSTSTSGSQGTLTAKAQGGDSMMTGTLHGSNDGPSSPSYTGNHSSYPFDANTIQSSTSKMASGNLAVKEDDRGRAIVDWDRRSNASSTFTVSSKVNVMDDGYAVVY